MDQVKVYSFESSLLKGEARRFSANFARPHPRVLYKDSAPLSSMIWGEDPIHPSTIAYDNLSDNLLSLHCK
jgi:hypothetical protein